MEWAWVRSDPTTVIAEPNPTIPSFFLVIWNCIALHCTLLKRLHARESLNAPLINIIGLSTPVHHSLLHLVHLFQSSPPIRLASPVALQPGRGALSSHSSGKVAIDDDDDDASIRSIRIYIHSLDCDTTHLRDSTYCEQPYYIVLCPRPPLTDWILFVSSPPPAYPRCSPHSDLPSHQLELWLSLLE